MAYTAWLHFQTMTLETQQKNVKMVSSKLLLSSLPTVFSADGKQEPVIASKGYPRDVIRVTNILFVFTLGSRF